MQRKPVVDADTNTMWNYEYQAKGPNGEILASDSLINLKRAVREDTRWGVAYLTCKEGALSYGQQVVDEYPYRPVRG